MIRDHRGLLVEAKARCKVGRSAPEVAEILGNKESLSWIKGRALRDMEVQSDCLLAIQAIKSNTSHFFYFGRVVEDCRNLLSELKHCNVSLRLIKRSVNSVAHFLVNAISFIVNRSWSGMDVPSELAIILFKNLN